MIGLVTASVVKDGVGAIVSRSEMAYDESGYQIISAGTTTNWQDPNTNYRGNPTTSRVWDSTKGAVTNPGAYIATHAQFDNFGNQRKAWDAKGNLIETDYTSPPGQDYKFAYPTKVTTPVPDPNPWQNPDGLAHGSQSSFETTATFDFATGLPLTTTDPNGLETRIEYDPVTLRTIRIRNYHSGQQVGSQSETVYHDEPNNYWVKSHAQIDADKWAESITYYNGLGRAYKTEDINSKGNIFVEKEFDDQGRAKRVTNPFRANEVKQWTTNVYDEAGRIKEVILPDGAKVFTDYGVSVSGVIGVTKQITDQAGKKRKGISDALGRMVRVIEDPTGQAFVTDYVFDTLGNLRKTIQGEQSRYFMHDSLGRLLYSKQPEQEANTAFVVTDSITGNASWSVKFEYDDNGNITKTTDARGVYVQGTYDNLNRLILRDYSDATPDVSFYYDGRGLPSIPNFSKGKTTKVSSSVSETRYTSFDNLGRLLTHQQITDGQTFQTSYTYNLSGAVIEETYPSGRVIKNVLNSDGDLALMQSRKNSNYGFFTYASGFKYNSSGAVEKMRLGNGRWETAVYNNRLQVTQTGLGTTDGDQSLLKLELSYGASTQNNGSLREQKITVPTVGSNQGFTAVQTYAYDDLNRIQSATETISNQQTWKQTFQYDRFGNRRFDATNTTTLSQSISWKVTNPLINTSDNRLTKDQDGDTLNDYDYDKAGNLTRDADGRQFLYDAENHQKEVKDINGVTMGQYLYDGEGRRVKKISSIETTVFVYDGGGQLVAEYSTQQSQTPTTSYLTTDHLGSARIVTDSVGNVIARKDFSAFGEETYTWQRTEGLGYKAENIRQDYTGYQKDDESGLEFAQARYYNASHGRYTSIDPLMASANVKNPQTFNRYSYVLNSPYKFTDPLGLISQGTGACGNRCANSDGSFGGGMASAYGSVEWIDVPEQQQQQQATAPGAAEGRQPEGTGAGEAGYGEHQEEQLYPGIQEGDAVYLDGGVILDYGQFKPTAEEQRLAANKLEPYNYVNFNVSPTMRIIERGTGEVRTGYQYSIEYDRL
jgi:RHS repeat-associated protein